jgi:hypothetical protein
MRRALTGDTLHTRVAQRTPIETCEKILALAEQYRTHSEMQFINKSGAQKLTDRRYTAAEAHIFVASRSLCLT